MVKLNVTREIDLSQVDIIDHKKDYCKLRFTCKCDYLNIDGDDGGASNDVQPNKSGESRG